MLNQMIVIVKKKLDFLNVIYNIVIYTAPRKKYQKRTLYNYNIKSFPDKVILIAGTYKNDIFQTDTSFVFNKQLHL